MTEGQALAGLTVSAKKAVYRAYERFSVEQSRAVDVAAHAAVEAERPRIEREATQRIREALEEQAAEYRREANEARQRGEQGGWEKLTAAGDVVECVTRIIFDSPEDSDP